MIQSGITWISGLCLVNSVTAHLLELLLYTSPPAYDLRTWSVLLNALMVALFSLGWKTHPLDLDQEMNLAFWPTRKTVKFCLSSEGIRTSLQANLTAFLGKQVMHFPFYCILLEILTGLGVWSQLKFLLLNSGLTLYKSAVEILFLALKHKHSG